MDRIDNNKIDFSEKLKNYFDCTPKEKILADWDESLEYDNIGVTVYDFLKYNNIKIMNLFEIAKNEIVNSTIIVHKYTTDFSKDYVVCEYDSHGSAVIYKGQFEAFVKDLYKKKNKFYLEIEVEGSTEHIEFNFFKHDLNVIKNKK